MNTTEITELNGLLKRSNYPLSSQTLSIQLKQTTGIEVKPSEIDKYFNDSKNKKYRIILDGNLKLYFYEGDDSDYTDDDIKKREKEERIAEKEAYPIVQKFLKEKYQVESNFNLFSQEKAIKRIKGTNRHRFPDIIGVYKPNWNTIEIPESILKNYSFPIYSYEVKTNLYLHNVRATFFECLSNSIFANRRFVVISHERKSIDKDALTEFIKLSEIYHVGLIEVRIKDKVKLTYDEDNSNMLLNCEFQNLNYDLFYDYLKNFPESNRKDINKYFNSIIKDNS